MSEPVTTSTPEVLDMAFAAWAPKVPALLSLIGSYTLIREVSVDLRNKRSRISRPLWRTLLAMSLADIFFSLAWFLGTWMSSADIDYSYGNAGNTATCTFQGFIIQFGYIAGPPLNVTYTYLTLLMLRYRWTDAQIARLEPWIQGAIWTFCVGGCPCAHSASNV